MSALKNQESVLGDYVQQLQKQKAERERKRREEETLRAAEAERLRIEEKERQKQAKKSVYIVVIIVSAVCSLSWALYGVEEGYSEFLVTTVALIFAIPAMYTAGLLGDKNY